MAQQRRRLAAELSRVWDQMVTKSKDQQQLFRNMTQAMVKGRTELPNAEQFVKDFKANVNKSMTAYEDFIGIRQVKEAHERVLQAELNFKESQNDRRLSQADLAEVQNKMRIIRVDIDRTPRGDNRYLELIKKEIDIINHERNVRARFEELEQREREVFSELSNALRFSHEKERAQSEKTKYWSILGSIIGAFIGIVGTTINSRLRHQQTKAILSETSSQVNQIEETVHQLVQRLDNEKSALAFQEHEDRLEKKTENLILATTAIEEKLGKLLIALAYHEENGLDPGVKPPILYEADRLEATYQRYRPQDKEMLISALGFVVISAIVYKLF